MEKRFIQLNDRRIEYTFKMSARSRSICISIYPGGSITVTAPRSINQRRVENFMVSKSQWILKKLDYFKNRQISPYDQQDPRRMLHGTRREFLKFKESARVLVHERIAHWNSIYGFPFKAVSIRNQKTRWGSCSKKGNLSFNYKIIHLPPKLADYLIVHELCHLKELNHSRAFWNLVAQTMPEYKKMRKELRSGMTLL